MIKDKSRDTSSLKLVRKADVTRTLNRISCRKRNVQQCLKRQILFWVNKNTLSLKTLSYLSEGLVPLCFDFSHRRSDSRVNLRNFFLGEDSKKNNNLKSTS